MQLDRARRALQNRTGFRHRGLHLTAGVNIRLIYLACRRRPGKPAAVPRRAQRIPVFDSFTEF